MVREREHGRIFALGGVCRKVGELQAVASVGAALDPLLASFDGAVEIVHFDAGAEPLLEPLRPICLAPLAREGPYDDTWHVRQAIDSCVEQRLVDRFSQERLVSLRIAVVFAQTVAPKHELGEAFGDGVDVEQRGLFFGAELRGKRALASAGVAANDVGFAQRRHSASHNVVRRPGPAPGIDAGGRGTHAPERRARPRKVVKSRGAEARPKKSRSGGSSVSLQPGAAPLDLRAMTTPWERAKEFCRRFGCQVPVLLAPMAGACPPSLSIAVANAGGMGAAGLLLHEPSHILGWMQEFRAASRGPVQLNLWIPDPPPARSALRESALRDFLAEWGPPVAADAGDAKPLDFDAQCAALLAAAPEVISSVMGLYPQPFAAEMKARGITWFAVVSSVAEARAAEEAGADVIVAQGAEAGGHRAAFDAASAERNMVGLFSLLPAVVDAVRVPVVATGGIADGRGVAAALLLGASAVQIGTAFLRCPEAKLPAAWADALATTLPEATVVSRVFSGRFGRSIATRYTLAATAAGAPEPAPYPVQRGLTAALRQEAVRAGDVQRMQAWAGQSAALARAEPAAEVVQRVWHEAEQLIA